MNAWHGRSGKISMMRVLSACVVGTALMLWVAANVVCLCRGGTWVSMDAQSVALILGVLAAKAGQRAFETKDIPKDLIQ